MTREGDEITRLEAEASASRLALERLALRFRSAGNTAAEEALRDEVVRAAQTVEAKREIETDDKLLAERQKVLDAIPCPVHGPCVPYALMMIEHWKRLASDLPAPAPGGEGESR